MPKRHFISMFFFWFSRSLWCCEFLGCCDIRVHISIHFYFDHLDCKALRQQELWEISVSNPIQSFPEEHWLMCTCFFFPLSLSVFFFYMSSGVFVCVCVCNCVVAPGHITWLNGGHLLWSVWLLFSIVLFSFVLRPTYSDSPGTLCHPDAP